MLHSGDNESMDLSLDMNEALAEMQMNEPWCNECHVLKQSLEDLRAACNHQATIISGLKEKIIPTDQLITDFYTKQEENQMLSKSLETCRRQCEELDQQLHSALARLEPLREANGKFERHIQRCEQDIEKLKAENEAYKICQHQSNLAHNALQEKLKKTEEEKKETQANLRRNEARLKKLQDEMAARKKENSDVKKENTALQNEIKALKAQMEKCKNSAVPCKPPLKNLEIQSPSVNVSAFCNREVSSLLTCPILQMLPPIQSPIPSSDAELSDSEASDNDLSINHFASQLEAKFGCSDDNLPLPNKVNDNTYKDIRADNDDEESHDDDETDFIPVRDEVNVSKTRRQLLTAERRLECQMSIGFETLTDKDDVAPQVSSRVPECGSLASSASACVPSTLDSMPLKRLMQKVTAGIKESGSFGHSSAEQLQSSSSSSGVVACAETLSASVLPLDIHIKDEGFLSATHSSSCSVNGHQSPNTSSICCSSSSSLTVASSSCTSTVFTSSISGSSVAVTCHANSPAPLYSFPSSSCLSSSIPGLMPLCTTKVSAAPTSSSKVIVLPGSLGVSSNGVSLLSPAASGVSKNSQIPADACTLRTSDRNSSAVFDLPASTNLPLSSASLTLEASDASHEIPATSAMSSQLSNSVSPPSQYTSMVTQCDSIVISDSLLSSSSRATGVNSGTANGALLTSAEVNVLASNTVPLCSPCVMDAAHSISSRALPCGSVGASRALHGNVSGVSVVTGNSVLLCSPGVTAEASKTTDIASVVSCSSVTASTTFKSVLAFSSCVALPHSTVSISASLSSHCISVSDPTSVSFSSCPSKFASGIALLASPVSSVPFKSLHFPPSEPDTSLNLSSLRSEISVEDIFKYISISPPLSPIHSPPKSATVSCKPLESILTADPQHTADSDLPSAACAQSCSPLATVSRALTVARQKKRLTVSSANHASSEIDNRSKTAKQKKAVKQTSSVLDVCPVPNKCLRNNCAATDSHQPRGESDLAGRVQSCLRQSRSASREKENTELPIKTKAVDHQLLPRISSPAVISPTIQTSDSSELIESIIKEALMLTEDVIPIWFDRCTLGQTPSAEPWLTPPQQKLLSDICKLGDVTVLKEFCKRAVQVLSRKGDLVMTSGTIALCCVFVSICRKLGDVERVRVFVYDAVRCQFCGYASLVTAVAATWPFPLQLTSISHDFSPVFYVLQHAVCAKSLDASKPKHQKMRVCLERLCGWRLPLETVDDIARHLLSYLKDAVEPSATSSEEVTWNVELAFELLCVIEGWQWSNNFVVVQLLWPILGSWAANPAEAKNQAFIEAVISILGRVMSHCPAVCRSNTDHILNILLTLLQEPTVVISIQLSVLRALLLLAKYQPDRCATMCLQWVKDHRNDLDPVTKAMLRDFHKQFSSKLKYLSELVID